jgi:hypothetical protein
MSDFFVLNSWVLVDKGNWNENSRSRSWSYQARQQNLHQ